MIADGDIVFSLSGGTSNTNPDQSLGGDPSVQPILAGRLFNDLADADSKAGIVDYRCFYINNVSNTESLYESSVAVVYTVPGAVTVQLGFGFNNERQNLTVANASTITGGSLTLTYSDLTQHVINVPWDANLAVWSSTLQAAINAIPNLQDVMVSASMSGTTAIFEIDFLGTARNRFHETIVVTTNALVPSVSASVVKVVSGAPINSVADVIDVGTTIPNNITFTSSLQVIGDLRPLDMVPVWVQRTVPANTPPIENDGFTLQVLGEAIP